MIGKGVFRENFQPHSCSGKKAPGTGQVKGNFKNIITIDSDEVDDVVILDFDEFLQQHGSSVPSRDRVCTPQSVISIDDDDDDESDDAEHPGNIAEGVGESDSASSSKKFTPAPSCMQNFVHIDVDDSHVSEKDFVSDMQKSRQTCSAKATGRNRYGLDRSESESSESDCSDCELLEVCEQWEKASIKRKRHVFNNQFSHDQHASSSRFPSNIYSDIEVENTAKQYSGSPVYSGPSNGKYVKESQSSFSVKADSQVKGIYSNLGTENPFKDSDKKDDQEISKSCRPESMEKMQSLHRSSDIEHGECTKSKEFVPCSKYTYYNFCNFCSGVTGASMSKEELGGMESKTTRLSQEACERQVDNNGSALRSKDDNLSEMRTLDSNCASFDERHVNCGGPVFHAQDGGFTASNQRDIINEREKLKETDEYKRVIEEEWASRQLQLQIQAEEAQRLRKRKKAEAQRLLDMQRRQKERIEEVRETQKKDEEFMNMKEQLRVEIQRGLNKLEKQCRDMASLLRGLGIHVGGGFIPLPDEVRAAYKRALLKFHPDRASKTDIREQVEAEEKFKLISRMKDRISLTLCR